MNRKQFEKRAVAEIAKNVASKGFISAESVFDASNHYYFFTKNLGDVIYRQFLRFSKPNFLSYDSTVDVYSQCIDELILRINPSTRILRSNFGFVFYETSSFCMLRFGLEHYTAPENKDNLTEFRWSRMKLNMKYIDQGSVTEKNIPQIAQEITDSFFAPVFNGIIQKTNSLEKIDGILNNLKELKIDNAKPPILSVCFPFSQQLAMGLILANYLERPDRKELTEKYLEVANGYGDDRFGYLDLLYRAATFFTGEVLPNRWTVIGVLLLNLSV